MGMRQRVEGTVDHLTILNGRDLAALARSGYLARLRQQGLAPSPAAAIERIAAAFGERPTRLGTNVPGIAAIRDAIWSAVGGAAVASGLVVTAPHTHWGADLPIIVSRIDRGYRVGARAPAACGRYTPVSFVFSRQGPLPYEWADDSIVIEPVDLERTWSTIHDVCMALAGHDWPLGLALNFRFKDLLSDQSIATLELQEDPDAASSSAALVVRSDEYPETQDDTTFEQVAWHAYSDCAYALKPEERELLAAIRQRVDGLASRAKLLSDVHRLLGDTPDQMAETAPS